MPKGKLKKNANTGRNQSTVKQYFRPVELPPPVDAHVAVDPNAASAAAEPTLAADTLTTAAASTAAAAAMPPEGADAAAHAPRVERFR